MQKVFGSVQRYFGFSKVQVVLMVVMIAAMMLGGAFAQTAPADPITQDTFTTLATKILTYLGYAVIAGLTVLAGVVGARRAWSFLRTFL